MDGHQYKVKEPIELFAFLSYLFKGKSRSAIKSMLSHKLVCVNGKIVSQYNYGLSVGQTVTIGSKSKVAVSDSLNGIKILFEDSSLIVIDKPSGLLTIASNNEKQETAYRIISQYVKRINPNNKIFILHRLDRDTSGVMMFAKNQNIQQLLQTNWDGAVTNRQYLAVVEGHMQPVSGTLTHYLIEGATGFIHVTKNEDQGQKAITHYETIEANRQYSLLKLTLETGRKNQIRVQLKEVGHPILGDKKYGTKTDIINRLALHAFNLHFIHPITKKEVAFSSPLPSKMHQLIKTRKVLKSL